MPDIARRYAIAESTIYRWKPKFGGTEVSEAKRLRELEAENAKLKRLLAEAEVEKAALKKLVEESGDGRATATGRRTPQDSQCQRTSSLPVGGLQSVGNLVSARGT